MTLIRSARPILRSQRVVPTIQTRGIKANGYPTVEALVAAFDARAHLPREQKAPYKPQIDLKYIIKNAPQVSSNCLLRNYDEAGAYPQSIAFLAHAREDLRTRQQFLRRKVTESEDDIKDAQKQLNGLKDPQTGEPMVASEETHQSIFRQAKAAKATLQENLKRERVLTEEIQRMSNLIPNDTSPLTPLGEAKVLGKINELKPNEAADFHARCLSHVNIGQDLNIIDFEASALTSGWGHYFLRGDGALLEQALINHALAVATSHKWRAVSAPSVVYNYIGKSCGFQPRDQNNEQQVYQLTKEKGDNSPTRVLAGTAEIPLAGSLAGRRLNSTELPIRTVAVSRCYRAEAGGRGADTRGLYRVHEFTKVELFGWSAPNLEAATDLFDEILDIQTEIFSSLGLHCRVLEMPASDLGASAFRKVDMEAIFPSRQKMPKTRGGWGEISSASLCTDYQTRRLDTRIASKQRQASFPWTVNGTALAVPRIIAAILETHWDPKVQAVVIPEVLRPYMGGKTHITGPKSKMLRFNPNFTKPVPAPWRKTLSEEYVDMPPVTAEERAKELSEMEQERKESTEALHSQIAADSEDVELDLEFEKAK